MQAFRNFIDAICYPFRIIARLPSNIISSPRRMMGLSLPFRAALLLFLGLLMVVIGWTIIVVSLDNRENWDSFLLKELPVPLLLTFVIPVVVWYALKLWLEGEPSPFPKIDQAWKTALDEMKKHEIRPSETPIFLVLGPSEPQEVQRFMASSNVQFPVQAPQGPAELHVFANRESIYVVCSKSCVLGTLLSSNMSTANVGIGMRPTPSAPDPTKTMQVGGDMGQFGSAAPPQGNPLGAPNPSETVALQPFGMPNQDATQVVNHAADPPTPPTPLNPAGGLDPPRQSPPTGLDAMQQTMQVGGFDNNANVGVEAATAQTLSPRLDTGSASQAADKLAYICRLIRRLRDPVAPINGVLCVTPFGLIADCAQETISQLLSASKADLSTIRLSMRVRCGVTHIVNGLEYEPGFRELIRRVGPERVASQRFGKGFGLWNLPVAEQLGALVKHACGAFEDWSYLLFREQDGLGRRGNRQLYGLLCRIRLKFMPRLSNLIVESYKVENASPSLAEREPLLFSGCYFVADGVTPDRQAFVGSVLGKTLGEEEELEWGSEAVADEKRMQTGVQVLLALNGFLLAAAIAMLIKMNL